MNRLDSFGTVSAFTLLVLSLSLAGCGGTGGAPKGKVSGKVTANGQPVTEGSLVFAPLGNVQSTAARGKVNSDGTYVLGTDAADDGAAIGSHVVVYNAPSDQQADWDGYGTPPPVKSSPFKFMKPNVTEVEVKAGNNEIDIQLIPAPPLSGS